MGFFKKKADPISARSRELTAKIAELEAQIKRLNQQSVPDDRPRIRSTAYPPGSTVPPRRASGSGGAEPVFEQVGQNQIKGPPEPLATPGHFNQLGAPKYDLLALLERIKKRLRGPRAANPKLVAYLAAGNIQGLRPLRYERRVARNRFIALTIIFVVVLFGIFYRLIRWP
jgi:hypothetical protein